MKVKAEELPSGDVDEDAAAAAARKRKKERKKERKRMEAEKAAAGEAAGERYPAAAGKRTLDGSMRVPALEAVPREHLAYEPLNALRLFHMQC